MKLYRKNKRNLMAVLLFVMLLGLSACGGKEDKDSSGSGKQSGKEESTAAEETDDEETAKEDSDKQYCDWEDCHNLMFPHIHITMDNWQDYFEFTTEYQFGNGVENMDKYLFTEAVFNVREEWRDKIFHPKIHYQIGYKEYAVPGTIDWDNQTVAVEENAEKTYSAHVDDQWYTVDAYNYDSDTGITGTHEKSMQNDREDYEGTILFWEPEMLSITDGAYLVLKE
ncbi:MAG TPA: hypothetical protein IAB98_10330 [Candidatus Egerieimonas intestinavium]|uniref:Lipoprotein n=1 Tax=Candidatus Egerieimonas intestinavium TaxID=2840777 RepID=A0A9D1EKP3_9FIRM|nr:hypothetical protein [Candidatus Egerieimonas intestinavium]